MENRIKFPVLVCFIILLPLFVSSCVTQPHSSAQTNTAQDYKPVADSVYVLSYLSARQPDFDVHVAKSVKDRFESEGYPLKYVSSNGLELNPVQHVDAARKFGAELIVTISPAGGTLEVAYFRSKLRDSKYLIKGIDIKSKRVVFVSRMDFYPYRDDLVKGIMWDSVSADRFAKDVFDELNNSGILAGKR